MSSCRLLSTAAVVGLWLFVLGPRAAVTAPAAPPTPRLVIEHPTHDAGRLGPDEVVQIDFTIRNEGGAPLTILDVKKDCGCLVPRYDEVLAPGKTGRVRVALRTRGFQGPIEKHVYLETDDPAHPSVALTIKAVLPRAVEVTPGSEVLLLVTRGRESATEVTLSSTDELPLEVGTLESTAPYLRAEVVPGSAATGKEVRVRLTVAADAPVDTFEALVLVETGHPRLSRLGLRVFGQPAASITVRPPRLGFGRIRPTETAPVERLLTLSRASGSFRVLKVEDSLGCLRAEATPAPDGASCEIRLVYAGGWKDEQTEGILRITTDDATRPVIEVPYTAQVW